MPTYDYECNSCKSHFEIFQGMNDAHLTICPKCKKKSLTRLVGAGSGIIFKGTGFYETDYKHKSSSSANSGSTQS